jgi:hypothetical protein
VLKKRIHDPILVKFIMQMINLDPAKRPSATECINRWNEFVFPDTFHTLFYQLCSQTLRLPHLYSDARVNLVRFYADAVFLKCLDIKEAALSQGFKIPMNSQIFRLLQQDEICERSKYLVPNQFKFFLMNMQTSADQLSDELSSDKKLTKT